MLPSRPGELAIPADAPAPRRVPALTATVVTLLYAVAYLVWERNDWGSPTIQNLVSNVAFMPLNLAVMLLTGLASRSPVLDPGVRRALRLLALGSVSRSLPIPGLDKHAIGFKSLADAIWRRAGVRPARRHDPRAPA